MPTCYFYTADEPHEFVRQGEYIGDLPENSTATPPPEPLAFTAYTWNGEAWDTVTDLRGTDIYDVSDGHREKITALSEEIPEGFTDIAPPDFPATFPTQYTFDGEAWIISPAKVNTALAAQHRETRNALLAASDFRVSADCMINAAQLLEFAKYRQWLRDLPTQSGFPTSPTYPTLPTYTKAIALDAWNTKTTQIATGNAFAIANPINPM